MEAHIDVRNHNVQDGKFVRPTRLFTRGADYCRRTGSLQGFRTEGEKALSSVEAEGRHDFAL